MASQGCGVDSGPDVTAAPEASTSVGRTATRSVKDPASRVCCATYATCSMGRVYVEGVWATYALAFPIGWPLVKTGYIRATHEDVVPTSDSLMKAFTFIEAP